ncbi:hypothetical protein RHMOL_Rhmol11G0209200 [Rhododendron molle]|uniref:Uncharacterized protein n=1 Tax=Rhododendron molle TaxID=49168 RepID=A0ACC0LUP2_RHOML|nr:hypothetical protein RHMOL_Rhmol11G0209200 [Rhododendron molle]
MGGIGKTTIAKVVYNSNHDRYDAACFLENISEVSKGHNGLVRLQIHLLSNILGKNERINNVDDGCWRIKYALSNKRVLVLDDVDQMDQLFALAGRQDWFSQGSKIIITTRTKSVMKNADEIYDVYWPKKLSNDESLELFSWHAFRQKRPIKSHMTLSKRNLLTIEDEKLQMHQLLQDMGKQIVCHESDYPEERSRIWLSKESFDILFEKIGTNKIKGLVLDMNMLGNSNKVVFEANTFEKMYNLRLLKLSGVQFSGSYKACSKRLRWLYWCGFPSESFPNDFPLENLVALDMRHSNLKQVWKGTKVLGSLKILNLSHSPKLAKTPDFSRIPNLEIN